MEFPVFISFSTFIIGVGVGVLGYGLYQKASERVRRERYENAQLYKWYAQHLCQMLRQRDAEISWLHARVRRLRGRLIELIAMQEK